MLRSTRFATRLPGKPRLLTTFEHEDSNRYSIIRGFPWLGALQRRRLESVVPSSLFACICGSLFLFWLRLRCARFFRGQQNAFHLFLRHTQSNQTHILSTPSRFTGSLDNLHGIKTQFGGRIIRILPKNRIHEIPRGFVQRVAQFRHRAAENPPPPLFRMDLHIALPQFLNQHTFGAVYPDFKMPLREHRITRACQGHQTTVLQFQQSVSYTSTSASALSNLAKTSTGSEAVKKPRKAAA